MRLHHFFESRNWGKSFEELAQAAPSYRAFLRSTDGLDVLYRGHDGDEQTHDDVFMTDYIGHAENYGEEIDAYGFAPHQVMFFTNQVFDDMRNHYRDMDRIARVNELNAILQGNRFGMMYRIGDIESALLSSQPYSDIIPDIDLNNSLIPVMQKWGRDHGHDIIAFLGSDYSDYGGQNEYVVGDVSRLTDLRKLYDREKGYRYFVMVPSMAFASISSGLQSDASLSKLQRHVLVAMGNYDIPTYPA